MGPVERSSTAPVARALRRVWRGHSCACGAGTPARVARALLPAFFDFFRVGRHPESLRFASRAESLP